MRFGTDLARWLALLAVILTGIGAMPAMAAGSHHPVTAAQQAPCHPCPMPDSAPAHAPACAACIACVTTGPVAMPEMPPAPLAVFGKPVPGCAMAPLALPGCDPPPPRA